MMTTPNALMRWGFWNVNDHDLNDALKNEIFRCKCFVLIRNILFTGRGGKPWGGGRQCSGISIFLIASSEPSNVSSSLSSILSSFSSPSASFSFSIYPSVAASASASSKISSSSLSRFALNGRGRRPVRQNVNCASNWSDLLDWSDLLL